MDIPIINRAPANGNPVPPASKKKHSKVVTHDTQDTDETQRTSKKTQRDTTSAAKAARDGESKDVKKCLEEAMERACEKDENDETWRTPLFNLARELKADEFFGKLQAPAVIGILRQWASDPVWQDKFYVDFDSACSELLHLWDRIRHLPGDKPLESAKRLSDATPLTLTKEIMLKRCGITTYQRFVSLSGWLQVVVGNDKPITLPCREVAALLGTDRMAVDRYRRWACEDGYLTLVSKHVWNGPAGKGNRATEFLFDITKWDVLKERTTDHDRVIPL